MLTTRDKPASPACLNRMNDLPAEILELILGALPMNCLLRCLRVCKLWRDRIKKSTNLREQLFWTPIRPKEGTQLVQPNPLLHKIFPAFLARTDGKSINKLIDELPWASDEQWSKAVAFPTATWREMYTEQPPRRQKFTFKSLASSEIERSMGHIYSIVVARCFWEDEGDVYDALCIQEKQPGVRTYIP